MELFSIRIQRTFQLVSTFIECSEPFFAFCILIWDDKILAFTVLVSDLPYMSS